MTQASEGGKQRANSFEDSSNENSDIGSRHLSKRQKFNYDISINDDFDEEEEEYYEQELEEEEEVDDQEVEDQEEEDQEFREYDSSRRQNDDEYEDTYLTRLDEKNKEILQNLDLLNAWIRGIRGVSALLKKDLNEFIENNANAEVKDENIDLVKDIIDIDLSQIDLSLTTFHDNLVTTKERTTTFQKDMRDKLKLIQQKQDTTKN